MKRKNIKLRRWGWTAIVGVLCIWIVALCFWGKTGRAVVIFEDRVISNGPYCGVKMYIMNNGICKYMYRDGGSKYEKEMTYEVDEENHSISLLYNHPLGLRHADFTFDIENEKLSYSYYGSLMSDFERFDVNKVDWGKVPSMFNNKGK